MSDVWRCSLILIITIIFSALFWISGAAVNLLNEKKLEKGASDGDKRAAKLLLLAKKKEVAVFAARIGSVLSALTGEGFAIKCFHLDLKNALLPSNPTSFDKGLASLVSFVIITFAYGFAYIFLSVGISERISKTIKESEDGKISKAAVFFTIVFRPLAYVVLKLSDGILALFGIKPEKTPDVTEDEILALVDKGEESGSIETGEKEMIENIFYLADTSASDIMTHRIDMTAINIEATEEEIENVIKESGFSRFPVYENDIDNIIGILSARKFFLNARSENPLPIRDILFTPYFVPESVRADVLLQDMRKNKVHMVIVIDEYGGTSGVVTMEDLLEEIVGNIYDETDDPLEEQEIIRLEENLWKVAGSVDLETLGEAIEIDFEELGFDEYDTLGGLVFSQLTAIPEDGSSTEVDVAGIHIKVISLVERRVEWALVSKIGKKEEISE